MKFRPSGKLEAGVLCLLLLAGGPAVRADVLPADGMEFAGLQEARGAFYGPAARKAVGWLAEGRPLEPQQPSESVTAGHLTGGAGASDIRLLTGAHQFLLSRREDFATVSHSVSTLKNNGFLPVLIKVSSGGDAPAAGEDGPQQDETALPDETQEPRQCRACRQAFETGLREGEGSETGGWNLDRYAPESFHSVEDPTGRDPEGHILLHQIGRLDGARHREEEYRSEFYSTQGYRFEILSSPAVRKQPAAQLHDAGAGVGQVSSGRQPVRAPDIPADAKKSPAVEEDECDCGEVAEAGATDSEFPGTLWSVDLFIPTEWKTSGRRMAGFWVAMTDAEHQETALPALEFVSDGTTGQFRFFSQDQDQIPANGITPGFISLGLPSDFAWDEWYTLSLGLNADGMTAQVQAATGPSVEKLELSDARPTATACGSAIILQGFNTEDGVAYAIYWDNVTSPETECCCLSAAALAGEDSPARPPSGTYWRTAEGQGRGGNGGAGGGAGAGGGTAGQNGLSPSGSGGGGGGGLPAGGGGGGLPGGGGFPGGGGGGGGGGGTGGGGGGGGFPFGGTGGSGGGGGGDPDEEEEGGGGVGTDPHVVPEPSSLILLASGLFAVLYSCLRKRTRYA